MLSRFAKTLLVATAFSPVLLTYAFVQYSNNGFAPGLVAPLVTAVSLVLICILTLKAAGSQLEEVAFEIDSVRTADSETVGFVVAYMLPFLSGTAISEAAVWFILGFVFLVAWNSNAYHFNPLLGMLGYHFYEVTTKSNVSFLLVTKRDLRNTKPISRVVQLTEYIVLDKR